MTAPGIVAAHDRLGQPRRDADGPRLRQRRPRCKFIACGPNAAVLLDAAGLVEPIRDEGYVDLTDTRKSAEAFVERCRPLRFWDRH